ncbi:MAG: hypothetical protein GY822_30210 [Deltaproteobacteria bacterium]|nr:hypothetical protein [Deltaproteobacteria bacterium]
MSAELLDGRQLVATGGVSKFIAAHLGHDVVTVKEIDDLRRSISQMPITERGAFLRQGKDESQQRALGIHTPEKAVGYARKLPASLSLLHHILRSLELPEVSVSSSDARHALVQEMASEAKKESESSPEL